MKPDVEVTVVMRFQNDREPDEQECREWVEDRWMGVLVDYDTQEV